MPKLTLKRPAFLTRKAPRAKLPVKLNAATAAQRMKPGIEDDYDDEPQTRLSSAFFVVLILHIVAVGGIYAFNSIKAHRRAYEPAVVSAKPVAEKPAAPAASPKQTATAAPESPGKAAATAPAAPPAQVATAPVSNAKVYHVKSGDTLIKIAAGLNVSVAELQFVNSPKDVANLKAGQIINVPTRKTAERTPAIEPPAPNPVPKKTAAAPAKAPAAPGTYEVQKGETPTSIAKHFNVSVDELLKLNKITDPTKLQSGTTIKVPSVKKK